MKPHDQLIENLGGTRAVAAALGQNLSTVSMWRVRGIPWRFRPAIVALARRLKKPVPATFLDPAA